VSLILGLAVVGLVSTAVAGLLDLFDDLPAGFALGDIPASQTHVGASTIAVALAAGVAGILAFETRASAAVGLPSPSRRSQPSRTSGWRWESARVERRSRRSRSSPSTWR
jgi:hypothetical protein